MKKMKRSSQILIGSISILLLWCIGAFSYGYMFIDIEFSPISDFLPNIVMLAMPVLLIILAFVGKRNNLKALYFSGVLSVGLPLFAYYLSHIFSDDGNILSWIYGFTLGLILYPFHLLASSTFSGAWLGMLGFNTDLCAGLLVAGIILSFIIYKFAKTKIKEDSISVIPNDNKRNNFEIES